MHTKRRLNSLEYFRLMEALEMVLQEKRATINKILKTIHLKILEMNSYKVRKLLSLYLKKVRLATQIE